MAPSHEEDAECKDDGDYFDDESDEESEEDLEENGKCERTWFGTFSLVFRHSLNIGTVWRMPVLICKHGEGAFLIPYIVMLIVMGIPLCSLDLALGQCSGLGAINVWKVTKFTTGVGYGLCCLIALVTVYMNMVVAWSIYYFFEAMREDDTPCNSCAYFYNCPEISNTSKFFDNCLREIERNVQLKNGSNDMDSAPSFTFFGNSSFELSLFENELTDLNINWDSSLITLGQMHWPIIASLFGMWIISYFGLIKGIKQLAYIGGLLILLISGFIFGIAVTLENRVHGIVDFFHISWESIGVLEMWHDATTQVLFSLGLSFGWPINLSSRKRYHGNCYTDSMWLVGGNAVASVWITLVTFAIMGSREFLQTFQYGLNNDSAFIFIGVSSMLVQLPGKTLTRALFFLGLIFVGVAFNVCLTKVIFYWLKTLPVVMTRTKKNLLLAALVCIVLFGCGCTLATSSGYSLVMIFDQYLVGWSAILFAVIECLVFGWLYGSQQITKTIEMKTDKSSFVPWRFLWQFTTPAILLFAFFVKWATHNADLDNRVKYSHIIGRILSTLPLLIIVVYSAVILIREYRKHRGSLFRVFKVSPDWNPTENSGSPFQVTFFGGGGPSDVHTTPDPIVLVHVEDDTFGAIPHGFFFNPSKRKSVTHVQQTHILLPPGDKQLQLERNLDKTLTVRPAFGGSYCDLSATNGQNSYEPSSGPSSTRLNGTHSPMIIRARRMPFPSTLSANTLSAITIVPAWVTTSSDKQKLRSIRRSFRSLRKSKSFVDCTTAASKSDSPPDSGGEVSRRRQTPQRGPSKPRNYLALPGPHDASNMGTSNPTFVIEEID